MQNVVYTAITSGYDTIKPFGIVNATHIHFNDPMFHEHTDPCRRAKYPKILAHKVLPVDTQYSMWIDGSIKLNPGLDFKDLIATYLKDTDIAVMKHPERDCIFQEAQAIIDMGKDDAKTVLDYITRYSHFPKNWGLGETGIVLRRHTKHIDALNEAWWEELENGSRRDQLSLPIVLDVYNISCTYIVGRPFLTVEPHIIQHPKPNRQAFRRDLKRGIHR
jgi:hypothetical protein